MQHVVTDGAHCMTLRNWLGYTNNYNQEHAIVSGGI